MGLLPTKTTAPENDPQKLVIAMHGGNGIGKTTFASQADKVLFLATEPGQRALECFKVDIDTWQAFHDVCVEIKAGQHEFKTVVIDTLTNLYKLCTKHFCDMYKVTHISDVPGFARGYDLVNNHMYSYIKNLSFLPYGVVLICHSSEKTVEQPGQAKYTKLVPDVPDGIRKRLIGLADILLYFTTEAVVGEDGVTTHRRAVKTQPTKFYEARDRFGFLPRTILLPEDVVGSYQTFVDAFNAGKAAKAAGKPIKQMEEKLTVTAEAGGQVEQSMDNDDGKANAKADVKSDVKSDVPTATNEQTTTGKSGDKNVAVSTAKK